MVERRISGQIENSSHSNKQEWRFATANPVKLRSRCVLQGSPMPKIFPKSGASLLAVMIAFIASSPPEAFAAQTGKKPAEIIAQCRSCHGGATPAGGLDLTTRETAIKGGGSGAALDLKQPLQSRIYTAVTSGKMPPGGPLSPDDKANLHDWLVKGAVWPINEAAHGSSKKAGRNWWSLIPPHLPSVPLVSASLSHTLKNPIDAFILSALAAKGLTTSQPASREVLIRRATYDLTGLPPTPTEIRTFCADRDPHAYEKLVDHLLASPHYGERWARHWLDVARFGESMGYEYDHLRDNAWRYRDWVVQAINSDMPYDRFLKEQIAGDVLPNATPSSVAATGFLVGGPMDEAGKASAGILVRQRAREEEMEDIIGLVGQTCLGLTVNCARCHDHKFDPISQHDYYSLKAALIGVNPGDRPLLTLEARRSAEANHRKLSVAAAGLRTQLATLEGVVTTRIFASRKQTVPPPGPLPELKWDFAASLADTIHQVPGTLSGNARRTERGLKLSGQGALFSSSALPVNFAAKTLEAWVYLDNLDQHGGSALTLEADTGTQFDAIVFGERQHAKWISGSNSFTRTRDLIAEQEDSSPDKPVHMVIVYGNDGSITLFRNGAQYAEAYAPQSQPAIYAGSRSHVIIGQRHTGAGQFLEGTVRLAALYGRALSPQEVKALYTGAAFSVSSDAIAAALLPLERERRSVLLKQIAEIDQKEQALGLDQSTYGVISGTPEPTFVLARGDVANKRDPVTPGGIAAVCTAAADFQLADASTDAERRLRLADWIVRPDNPLTARVFVNRVWQHHFGLALVGTPNDFGYNGEKPSNPALLDWLACQFQATSGKYACGGSVKKLHRLIMLCGAYRQGSKPNANASKVDADGRLLWRFTPRRLEAEEVRDSMLAISGQINMKMGGPSFRPFKVETYGSNFYRQFDDASPEFNRRSIYRMSVQSARNAMLEALDCPDPSTKTPRRTSTTTPIQALELMNEPFVLRQAEKLGDRLKAQYPHAVQQIQAAFCLAFGRQPEESELQTCKQFLSKHTLASFCWSLLNSSEFLYIK